MCFCTTQIVQDCLGIYDPQSSVSSFWPHSQAELDLFCTLLLLSVSTVTWCLGRFVLEVSRFEKVSRSLRPRLQSELSWCIEFMLSLDGNVTSLIGWLFPWITSFGNLGPDPRQWYSVCSFHYTLILQFEMEPVGAGMTLQHILPGSHP